MQAKKRSEGILRRAFFEEQQLGYLFASCAVFVLIRVLIAMLLGVSALAYLFPAFELFFYAFLLFHFLIRRILARNIRYYIERKQLRNAKEECKRAYRLFLFPTFLLSLLLGMGGLKFSVYLNGAPKSGYAFSLAAFLPLLLFLQGMIQAQWEGDFKKSFSTFADLLRMLLSLLFAVFFALFGDQYGKRVDLLLYTNDSAYCYVAIFSVIGLLLANLITLLFLLTAHIKFRTDMARQLKKAKPAFLSKDLPLMTLMFQGFFHLFLPELLLLSGLFLTVFFHHLRRPDRDLPSLVGMYYAYFHSFSLLISLVVVIPFLKSGTRLIGAWKRKRRELSLSLYRQFIHGQCVILFPLSAFFLALSEQIGTSLFGISTPMMNRLLGCGAFLMIFVSLSISGGVVLSAVHLRRLCLFNSFASSMIGGILLVGGIFLFKKGLSVVILSEIAYFFIYDLLLLYELDAMMQVHGRDLVKTFLLPFGIASVCAFVIYVIGRPLKLLVGDIVTMMGCIVVGTLLYLYLIRRLHGLTDHEIAVLDRNLNFRKKRE